MLLYLRDSFISNSLILRLLSSCSFFSFEHDNIGCNLNATIYCFCPLNPESHSLNIESSVFDANYSVGVWPAKGFYVEQSKGLIAMAQRGFEIFASP